MTNDKAVQPDPGKLPDGAAFLESLVDGREIWFEGERVDNVVTHPAFANSARSLGRLYDALHDPGQRDTLLTVDKHGITTHRFFAPSYSSDDLLKSRDAIAAWQRLSFGWMGRTPDYKAAFVAQMAESHGTYAPYSDNALAWYKRTAERCLFLNHVLVDPPVDRNNQDSAGRVFLHVTRDDDKGIYVSGAKAVATGSVLTNATFVALNLGTAMRLRPGEEDRALVFLIDMDAPGLRLLTRPSYESAARSPFDAPLSSRFDENDSVMIFDDAFVPWENVLVYRDLEKARGFYEHSGFFNRFNFQSAIRLCVKLEFTVGLLLKGVAASGTGDFRGVQASVGELIGLRDLLWAVTTAMAMDPEPGVGETVVPKQQTAAAARVYMTNAWTRVREVFECILAGAPIYSVSSHRDLLSDELAQTIETYYQGTNLPGPERIKLFKLIWDAMYSEFAARHALYERNYSGNQDQQRVDIWRWCEARGDADDYRAMVEQCMDDYDAKGWVAGPWD